MAFYIEPTHDNIARNTAISKSEGRLRDDSMVQKKRKKKNKYVREVLDGAGGCGKGKKY